MQFKALGEIHLTFHSLHLLLGGEREGVESELTLQLFKGHIFIYNCDDSNQIHFWMECKHE